MIDAVPIRADADLSQIGEMPIEVEAFTALKETPPDVFKATVMLWTWAWRQVPPGTLPDADDALAAMAGLRRDVWQRMREQVLDGFEKASDGRLHHHVLEAKAITMLAEAEKRRKRQADDRRRQKLHYDRKTGKAPPKVSHVEVPASGTPAPQPVSALSPPSHPPLGTVSSQPNGPSISHGDPVREVKPHNSNDQWDPDQLTQSGWDRVVRRHAISGNWASCFGPAPGHPGCKAPAEILLRHGFDVRVLEPI